MTIAIYIDSCAWNYLHDRAIDLATELPSDIYTLHLTREAEIEIEAIPNGGKKEALKAYIFASIERSSIKTASVFGFQTLDLTACPQKPKFTADSDRARFNPTQIENFMHCQRLSASYAEKLTQDRVE